MTPVLPNLSPKTKAETENSPATISTPTPTNKTFAKTYHESIKNSDGPHQLSHPMNSTDVETPARKNHKDSNSHPAITSKTIASPLTLSSPSLSTSPKAHARHHLVLPSHKHPRVTTTKQSIDTTSIAKDTKTISPKKVDLHTTRHATGTKQAQHYKTSHIHNQSTIHNMSTTNSQTTISQTTIDNPAAISQTAIHSKTARPAPIDSAQTSTPHQTIKRSSQTVSPTPLDSITKPGNQHHPASPMNKQTRAAQTSSPSQSQPLTVLSTGIAASTAPHTALPEKSKTVPFATGPKNTHTLASTAPPVESQREPPSQKQISLIKLSKGQTTVLPEKTHTAGSGQPTLLNTSSLTTASTSRETSTIGAEPPTVSTANSLGATSPPPTPAPPAWQIQWQQPVGSEQWAVTVVSPHQEALTLRKYDTSHNDLVTIQAANPSPQWGQQQAALQPSWNALFGHGVTLDVQTGDGSASQNSSTAQPAETLRGETTATISGKSSELSSTNHHPTLYW